MSAFNLVPAWKMHSIRARQQTARRQTRPAAPAAPFRLADLSLITRHVLRLIAGAGGISILDLERKADLDTYARPHADELVLHGLVSRLDGRYALTAAGLHALQAGTAEDQQLARQAPSSIRSA